MRDLLILVGIMFCGAPAPNDEQNDDDDGDDHIENDVSRGA